MSRETISAIVPRLAVLALACALSGCGAASPTATDEAPTLPPEPSPVLVFSMMQAGNWDLYRIDLDGHNLVRLTSDPGADLEPTVQGGRVVFVRFDARHNSPDLWSMPLDGGPETRLTDTPEQERFPALRPDGARLAFVRDGALHLSGASDLSDAVPVADAVQGGAAWAPTGNRIAFSTGGNMLGAYPPARPVLYATDATSPAWGAESIAFIRGGAVWLLSLSSGVERRIGGTNIVSAAWTAESSPRLVLAQATGGAVSAHVVDPASAAPEIQPLRLPLGASVHNLTVAR